MKLWIARDECGDLWLYSVEPKKYNDKGFFDTERIAMELPTTEFPEINFNNSPQEVELKLISNETRR